MSSGTPHGWYSSYLGSRGALAEALERSVWIDRNPAAPSRVHAYMHLLFRSLLVWGLGAVLAACTAAKPPPAEDTDAEDTDGPDTDGPGIDDTGIDDTRERVELPPIGTVSVTEWRDADGCVNSSVSAWGLHDRPPEPSSYGVHAEYMDDATPLIDGCAVIEPFSGHCEPACDRGSFCRGDDTCQPWPAHLSAGPLELGGLSTGLTLERSDIGIYYVTTDPPRALFGDAAVTLSALGDELPGFSASTPVPRHLDHVLDCDAVLEPTADLRLSWTPQDPRMRVRYTFSRTPHGGGGGTILCEVPDSAGEMIVSEKILGGHLSSDWGYSVTLSRYSRGAAPLGAGEARIEAHAASAYGMIRIC